MHNFFPFLQTTARSEGFNAVLKRYVNPLNLILNFVHQYKKIQDRIFSKQVMHKADTVIKVPHYLTGHPMERQMKEMYAIRLFNVFQDELQLSLSYYIVCIDGNNLIDGPIWVLPSPILWKENIQGDSEHAFDAFVVREVPDQYILPRWSAEKVDDGDNAEVAGDHLQPTQITTHGRHTVRYNTMCTNFAKIVRLFMIDDEGHEIVLKHVVALQSELNTHKKRKMSSSTSEIQGLQAGGQSQGNASASRRNTKSKKQSKATDVDTLAAAPLQSGMSTCAL
ncbi:hypothetical protein BAE44_0004981 [Dichanthelium oligosanthes]|uniref:Protein FAR1-RELATED SEQUENCE n=1 Tax=Dichanthelium oligosanthes TaxID=888268 RepID=A0A1E5W9B0_9POAL|nr:hypothetical protein BAE44_0004981 [Dichanthelium oligosanthes]